MNHQGREKPPGPAIPCNPWSQRNESRRKDGRAAEAGKVGKAGKAGKAGKTGVGPKGGCRVGGLLAPGCCTLNFLRAYRAFVCQQMQQKKQRLNGS